MLTQTPEAMNLITVMRKFSTQTECIQHLETVRWGNEPKCPLCGSCNVARKAEKGRVGRWNCHKCAASFNVLSGTIFAKTRIPLPKWFAAIALIVNAKKSISSCQLARDLGMNQRSAWYMQQRIRAAMMADDGPMLRGIVEADETYIGGKPRKANRRENDRKNKPGRGTDKTPVLGVVERGGNVKVQQTPDVTGRSILRFLKGVVDKKQATLITDEFPSYNSARQTFESKTINHSVAYSLSGVHINTIESFWALLKRAWYGTHHHYTDDWMALFIAEGAWKYNQRKNPRPFDTLITSAILA